MTENVFYHATKWSDLKSILENGLKTEFFGKVHGEMDYNSGKNIYLSSNELSGNLNTNLFKDETDPVIILEIDGSFIDKEYLYPDDAFYYVLYDDILSNIEDINDKAMIKEASFVLSEYLNINKKSAKAIILELLSENDEKHPEICKKIAIDYFRKEGEVAYGKDISPEAILRWDFYDNIVLNQSSMVKP